MKKIREYPAVCPREDDPTAYQKTTYKLTPDEWDEINYLQEVRGWSWHDAVAEVTGARDGWQGPGGRYWNYFFSVTEKRKYLTIEEKMGIDW